MSGRGISCFTGHKNLPLFAFAEATTQSRIMVLTHPDNTVVSILAKANQVVEYIHLSFSETEHLVALTGMPNYCLEIWHWRSKDLLTSTPTDILTDKQTIGCSLTSPLTICQYALYKGELNVWEVQGSANFCKLIQKPISLPSNEGKFDHTFSNDGVLYLINRFGNVYQISTSTSSANMIVKWPDDGGQQYSCSVEYLRTGLVVSGPNGEVVYFKKVKNQWTQLWSVATDDHFCMLKCLISKEFIIGVTRDCKLMKITADGDSLKMAAVREFDVRYKCFVLVAPSKNLLVTINDTDQIEVFDVSTGARISKLSVHGALQLESHPRHPYVAVGSKDGVVYIVSLTVPNELKIVAELFLSNVAIDKIVFSASGALIAFLDINANVFLTRGWPDKRIYEIIHHSVEPIPPIGLSITEMADDEKLFVLLASAQYGKLAGDQLIGYKINESSHFNMKLPIFYSSLLSSRAPERTLFGVPFKSRSIHVLKITAVRIEILHVIQTPNLVRHVEIYVDTRNLLVWGTDGIVTLFDLETRELIMTQTLHNQQNSGVKKAECSPCFRYIVTLGHSGNLVCTKVAYESFDPAFYEQPSQQLSDLDIPPTVIPASGQTYVDIVRDKLKLDEELAHKNEKQSLQSELANIKRQLVHMLDKNEQATNDEMLSIQSFNLDVDGVAATLEHGRLERDEAKNCMLKFIEYQKLVNQYILEMCWNRMDKKGTNLRGIFTSLKVENYAIPQIQSERDLKSCVRFLRNMEDLVGTNDAFLPWKPIPIK
jgi:WD40 repeat protein